MMNDVKKIILICFEFNHNLQGCFYVRFNFKMSKLKLFHCLVRCISVRIWKIVKWIYLHEINQSNFIQMYDFYSRIPPKLWPTKIFEPLGGVQSVLRWQQWVFHAVRKSTSLYKYSRYKAIGWSPFVFCLSIK